MKNPTPRQIALLAAAILTGMMLAILLFTQLYNQLLNWWILLISAALFFPATYLFTMYMLEQFIYRKVKVIYKAIHDSKRTKTSVKQLSLRDNFLDDVESEVLEWTEDRQKEIDELRQTEQYRREYLGNVSHELKTPIFNIQGYIHTLIDGGLKDERINLDYLYKAAKNAERLNTIVEDLEAIALLESGTLAMEMRAFDIYTLTREVYESLEMQADASDIELAFKKGCEKQTMVLGDRDRIRQVLVNLITNSIKYGTENGRTLVGFYDMDPNILIEVSDDGIGINKDDLPRVFERFYRVDKSRSRHMGGTGLGLSIVKHIMEAHNQTINVRSTKDEGSTFAFTLEKA